MRWAMLVGLVVVGSAGCTHRQLSRSTVQTTGTIMEIEYRTVLTNLALLSRHPETLPNHVRLRDGVVQINDSVGFGDAGGFTTFNASALGIERFGPSGSRQVSEQWGTDAVCDPRVVKALQDVYRAALGLPPLPDPASIMFVQQEEKLSARAKTPELSEGASPARLAVFADGGTGPSDSQGGHTPEDKADAPVPVEVLLVDVPPPGWFCLGGLRDVPKDACYVGHFGDRYAWVTADGVPALARLTLTVLSATKLKPTSSAALRGLTFTR